MSSRRIRAMARLIDEIEGEINRWYRTRNKPGALMTPEGVLSLLAVKLAGYRKEMRKDPSKGEAPPTAEQSP